MGVYRRPVSARRNIKSRKASTPKRTYTPPRSKARSNLAITEVQPLREWLFIAVWACQIDFELVRV